MSCEQNVINYLKSHNTNNNGIDKVFVIATVNGELRPYNSKVFTKQFKNECPRGFSYHVALCELGKNNLPITILDPSLQKVKEKSLKDYMETAIAAPESDDSPVLYGVIDISDFLLQVTNKTFMALNVPGLKLTNI